MLRLLRKFNLTPIRTSLHYLLVLNVGMDGLLGVSGTIITSDYDHSRLAPERLYITIKSPPLSSVHHHSHPTDTIHPCNPSPCVSGTCSGRLWDFMLSKCAASADRCHVGPALGTSDRSRHAPGGSERELGDRGRTGVEFIMVSPCFTNNKKGISMDLTINT